MIKQLQRIKILESTRNTVETCLDSSISNTIAWHETVFNRYYSDVFVSL